MGRSVSVPTNAISTVFLDVQEMQDESGEFFWEDISEDIRNVVQERYPSFSSEDKWVDREDYCVLENGHAKVVISHYGHLMSVSLVPQTNDCDWSREVLAESWCNQVADTFASHVKMRYAGCALNRIGTMSNGVSVYQKA